MLQLKGLQMITTCDWTSAPICDYNLWWEISAKLCGCSQFKAQVIPMGKLSLRDAIACIKAQPVAKTVVKKPKAQPVAKTVVNRPSALRPGWCSIAIVRCSVPYSWQESEQCQSWWLFVQRSVALLSSPESPEQVQGN